MDRRSTIQALIAEELAGLPVEQHDPETGHPLQVNPLGAAEVGAAVDVLLGGWVTMGREVAAFEQEWSSYVGCAQSVMVNSGSSANLLAFEALLECGRLRRGDRVAVPAVAWSTSLFPVAQAGLVPVLVDVHPDTLTLDPRRIPPGVKAALAVHLLGQPTDMGALDGLVVVEDACAAHGATIGGRRVGSIGVLGTFSFFFSHHITTIEGGAVTTSDPELADALRSLRAHGWVRERSDRAELEAQNPGIDPRFLFVSAGYNLRPTEIAGAIGRAQLRRLPEWLARRQANHRAWCAALEGIVRTFPGSDGHAAFAFPFFVDDRPRAVAALEAAGIQTRAISGSNLVLQPAFARVPRAEVAGPLPVAEEVHSRGIFVGNSHAFGPGHGQRLARVLAGVH